MPSLIKQHGRYYVQFYNTHRQPKQKRVALGTGNRRVAEQLQSRLIAAFLLGEYDPWGEAYREITTLEEAFAAFMERKKNLRQNTQDNYRWVVGSFVRHAGPELSIPALARRHQNGPPSALQLLATSGNLLSIPRLARTAEI